MNSSPPPISGTPLTAGLTPFRNRHRGERCFVVGCAPSLRQLDLSRLDGEWAFTVNRGYLASEFGLPRTPYYVMGDPYTYQAYVGEIRNAALGQRFYRTNVVLLPEYRNAPNPEPVVEYPYHEAPTMDEGHFAEDITAGAYRGFTVVLDAVQIAFFMGFTEVYIVGCDLDYQGTQTHVYGSGAYEQSRRHDMPIPKVLTAMSVALGVFNRHGRRLVNAGVGGRLDVIPRIDYASLFPSARIVTPAANPVPAMTTPAPQPKPTPPVPVPSTVPKPTFVSFLLPYVDRGHGPTIYHWLMLKQLGTLGTRQLALIADDHYFQQSAPWGQDTAVCDFPIHLPNRAEFDRMLKCAIPAAVFADLDRRSRSQLDAFRTLLSEDYPPLRHAIAEHLRALSQHGPIEAILAWCNIPSLQLAAAQLGLPVIHNELGPFRPPLYQYTVYFDFSGVNGQTSAAADMARFCAEARHWLGFTPLSLDELRTLFARTAQVTAGPKAQPRFKAGAALQVEYDSNLLVFANGLNNFETLYVARKGLDPGDLLIRHHPGGHAAYSSALGVLDESPDTLAFIHQCEEVFVINSSVAFECLLQGKPVRILGDSPAAPLSSERMARLSPQDRLLSLNYLFLCYLAPASLLYDVDYYRWRLTRPPLREIYEKHLAVFRQQQALVSPTPSTLPGKLDGAAIAARATTLSAKQLDALRLAPGLAELERVCRERDQTIQMLDKLCRDRQATIELLDKLCREREETIRNLDQLCRSLQSTPNPAPPTTPPVASPAPAPIDTPQAPPAPPVDPNPLVADALHQADARCRQGDVAGARAILQQAIAECPEPAVLADVLGNLEWQAGQPDAARAAYEEAARRNPDSAEAHFKVAFAAWNLRDHPGCESALGQSIALDPTRPEALSLVGFLRLDQGRFVDAGRAFEQVLDRQPDNLNALLGLIKVEFKEGDLTAARLDCLRALKLDPGNTIATEALHIIDTERARAAQAIQVLGSDPAPDRSRWLERYGQREYPCASPFRQLYLVPRQNLDVRFCSYHPPLFFDRQEALYAEGIAALDRILDRNDSLARRRAVFLEGQYTAAGCSEQCVWYNRWKVTGQGFRLADHLAPDNRLNVGNIWLSLGPDCNVTCRYCLEPAEFQTDFRTCSPAIMPLIRDYVRRGGDLIFTGGETFLPKWGFAQTLEQLVAWGDARGKISLHTNGTYLNEKNRDLLLRGPVTSVGISMDTLRPDLYEYLRRGTRFSHVWDCATRLVQERAARHLRAPSIILLCAVMKSTADHLRETVDRAVAAGLGISLNALFQSYYSPTFSRREGLQNLTLPELDALFHTIEDIERDYGPKGPVHYQGFKGQLEHIIGCVRSGHGDRQVVLGGGGHAHRHPFFQDIAAAEDLVANHRFPEARALLEPLREKAARSTRFLHALAALESAENRPAAAAACHERILNLDPRDERARGLLALAPATGPETSASAN